METNTQPKAALVALARDEDRYIDEWLSYHLKLGFDRIVVLQNNWRYKGVFTDPRVAWETDDTDVRSQSVSPQGKANQSRIYTEWAKRLGDEGFSHVMALDIDEFLVLKMDRTVQEFLQRHPSNACIFVRWRIFGDNGLTDPSGDSVLKRFTRCGRDLHPNGKSIAGILRSHGGVRWADPHHLAHPATGKAWRRAIGGHEAEVFHYRNKTRIERDARTVNLQGDRPDTLFDVYNQNDVQNTRARDFLYPPPPPKSMFPVDAAFAVCYTGYRDRRYQTLIEEVERVGLAPVTHIVWQYPTPYDKWEMDRLPRCKELRSIGWWSCSKGHYYAIKTAYGLGCRSALFLEDDCRFLMDLDQLKTSLSHLPRSWDVLMLDYHHSKGGRDSRRDSNRWWKARTRAYSTGAYMLSRRAMKRIIELYETPAVKTGPHDVCRPSDHWLNKWMLTWKYKLYIATPQLAVQAIRLPSTGGAKQWCRYLYKGMNMNLYRREGTK